jgi:phosphatidylserine/phosphatidylglycerophosphate/cardiolipin synthase-like enzyme
VRPAIGAAARTALVALLLAIAACDRSDSGASDRYPASRGESHPADADDPAPADHTDADEPGSVAGTVDTGDGEGIGVFFSHCYDNDPAAIEADTTNIDRSVASFIASARRTLDCAFYELESDRVADGLIAARARGVRVRMVGESDYRDNVQAQRVIAAGIPIVWDERSALMHNKFIVADDDAVWTGSYNVTDNCSFRNNNNAVSIRSTELAENYRTEFEEMFVSHRFGPRSPSNTPHTFVDVAGTGVSNYFAPEDDIPPKIVRYLRAAKKSIRVLAFSFTDTTIANALAARHRAGVDVHVVMEKRGSGGRGSVFEALRAAGIDVVTDGNRFVMHHKVIVIDGTWTITGSYNFTNAAATSNDENILIIKSPTVARRFEAEFDRVRSMAPQLAAAH